MVRIKRSYRIQVCGTKMPPMASSPRILNRQTGTVKTPKLCKQPLSQFIIAPRAQASRRCETQATLAGKPPSFATVSVPWTPSARSANLIAGDGTKNGFPAPNKELAINRKQPLDRKSPIQVMCELDFRKPAAAAAAPPGLSPIVALGEAVPRHATWVLFTRGSWHATRHL